MMNLPMVLSKSEEYESAKLDIIWKRVIMEHHRNSSQSLEKKQIEESRRLSSMRHSEYDQYQDLIGEIVTLKSICRDQLPKFNFTLPKYYLEKRYQEKSFMKHEGHTSLEVAMPHDYEDNIMKQTKLRKSLIFKQTLKTQLDEDLKALPFIEEDALDLIALLELSTKRSFMYRKRVNIPTNFNDSKRLPYMREIAEKPKAGVLVSSFVKDHILKLPILLPNAERIKELYKHCILKDTNLGRLFTTRRDILPKDLQDYVRDFGNGDLDMSGSPQIIKDEMADRDQFFNTSMNMHCTDILREIEIESLEFSVFIKPCYILYFSQIMPDVYLLQNIHHINNCRAHIEDMVRTVGEDFFNPIAVSRKSLMSVFMIANVEHSISSIVLESMNMWLENILRGLFSTHSPIREESCYCLAYLFTQSHFIMEIIQVYHADFIYDVISIIFKAIDHYEMSFEFYFSLIGYIMDGCPIIVILQCITDKGPLSKHIYMRRHWPRFIVFACKHWPSESFKGCETSIKKISDLLEKSYNNKITYKTSRMALAYIGRRFDKKLRTVTHWTLNKCGPTEE